MPIQLICSDIKKAIRSVLANEVHDVLSKVGHILCHGKAHMTERVCLVPDDLVIWQVILEPLTLLDCRKLVEGADEETGGDRELVDWDLRRGNLAILVEILNGAEVVPQELTVTHNRLRVVNHCLIATTCWIVLEQHIKSIQVVDIRVCISEPLQDGRTRTFFIGAEDLRSLLLHPVGIEQVKGTQFVCKVLDLLPIRSDLLEQLVFDKV